MGQASGNHRLKADCLSSGSQHFLLPSLSSLPPISHQRLCLQNTKYADSSNTLDVEEIFHLHLFMLGSRSQRVSLMKLLVALQKLRYMWVYIHIYTRTHTHTRTHAPISVCDGKFILKFSVQASSGLYE